MSTLANAGTDPHIGAGRLSPWSASTAPRGINAHLAPDPIEALATNHLTVYNHLASGEALYACGDDHGGATIRLLVTGLRQLPAQTAR